MSLNVVVIAVIAIVVLVVLIIMLTGKTRILGKTSSDCQARGGECIPAGGPCDGARYTFGTDCPENEPHCCVPMGGPSGGGSEDSESQESEDS